MYHDTNPFDPMGQGQDPMEQWRNQQQGIVPGAPTPGQAPAPVSNPYVPQAGAGAAAATSGMPDSNATAPAPQQQQSYAPPSGTRESFQALTQGKAPTPQNLIAMEGELNKQGIKVLRNAAGVAGKVQMPSGEMVDVIEAAGLGGKAWQWLQDDPKFGHGGGGGGGGGGGAYRPGQGVAGQGSIFGGNQLGSQQGNALFQQLMGRAGQSLDVKATDPLIQRQTEAFGAQQSRAQNKYEQALAERAGNQANIGMEQRAGAERIGQATSEYEGQLMQKEVGARRQEIEQALSGAQGFLTAQQQMQLQEELAQLGLAQNAYQFDVTDQFRNSPLYGGG